MIAAATAATVGGSTPEWKTCLDYVLAECPSNCKTRNCLSGIDECTDLPDCPELVKDSSFAIHCAAEGLMGDYHRSTCPSECSIPNCETDGSAANMKKASCIAAEEKTSGSFTAACGRLLPGPSSPVPTECPAGVQDDIDSMYSECGGLLNVNDVESWDTKAKETFVDSGDLAACGCSAGSVVGPSLVMAAVAVFAQFM